MILVTGASGIVGSHIIKQLLSDKQSVKAIKRKTSDISWTGNINHEIEWVEADVLDLLSLDKAFTNITKVVHCAAIISFDNSNDAEMSRVNIEGTKNILTLCQKHNIQKFVYISSVAALGRSSHKDIITEKAKWVTSTLNTSYAISKYLAELEVWRAEEEGLATVILNPSVIIGPGNWQSSSTNLFKHIKKGNPLYPIGSLNYVDVRDVAIIASQLLTGNIRGQRYIINAGVISYKKMFDLIAKNMNKKTPFLKVSPKLAIFVASILRGVRFLTGIKSNITKEAVLLSQLNIFFSAKKIENELNYQFRSLEDSISWTYKELESKTFNH